MIGKFTDELDRKNKARKEWLAEVEAEGTDTPAMRNEIDASNEVAWEVGTFSDPPRDSETIPEDKLQGLIVRTRRESLTSKLNSAYLVEAIDPIRKRVNQINADIQTIKWLLVAILLALLFHIYWQ